MKDSVKRKLLGEVDLLLERRSEYGQNCHNMNPEAAACDLSELDLFGRQIRVYLSNNKVQRLWTDRVSDRKLDRSFSRSTRDTP